MGCPDFAYSFKERNFHKQHDKTLNAVIDFEFEVINETKIREILKLEHKEKYEEVK